MAKIERYKTLTSEGPVFPAPYKYKGATLKGEKLSPLAEEMLWKLAHYIESDYWKETTFRNNVWFCLKPQLTPMQQKLNFPEDFTLLLTKMKELKDKQKEAKAARPKEEKIKEKEGKEALKAKYGVCLVDGQPVAIGGYLVEEANWILTRGKDPRKGLWKSSVDEEDVTLNVVNAKPPVGWKGKIESNPKSVWVYKYQQLCGFGNRATLLNKVVSFSKNTDIGKQMTGEKYAKAENILTSWHKIEQFIDRALKVNDPEIQESAVIAYLISLTGIRIGNERDETRQALTYGMSTLLKKHIKL
jgi:DNA topoisomerase IB